MKLRTLDSDDSSCFQLPDGGCSDKELLWRDASGEWDQLPNTTRRGGDAAVAAESQGQCRQADQ